MNRKNMSFVERQIFETKTLPYAQALLSKMGFTDVQSTVGTKLDYNNATDFTGHLKGEQKNIAYRCRNRNSFNYRDIGFRCTTNNNSKTEFDKIKEGLVDYYLYVYLRKDDSFCYNYFLLDVQYANNKLEKVERRISAFHTPDEIRSVKDASFAHFKLEKLKRYIVVNSFLL